MITIGSRSSQLATWQAKHIQALLTDLGESVEIKYISTEGDTSTQSLREFGGQGAFTKRIQHALLDGEIDLAVHSLKDLPTEKVDGLELASVPQREQVMDVWVSNKFHSFMAADSGILIGTGSLRRQAQLLHLRQDIKVGDIRGNVDTRLKKLDDGEYDAIVLAKAGMHRLGLNDRIQSEFQISEILPAVGQGALGLECRTDDEVTRSTLLKIDHFSSHASVIAERSLLRQLRAGCLAPVGAFAHVTDLDVLELKAVVLSQDGTTRIEGQRSGSRDQAESLGIELANQLIGDGADALLQRDP